MADRDLEAREQQFIDEWGLIVQASGASPIMGRIFGYLMICVPPVQSSAQIAEAIHASKGSISTGTRQLIAAGLIEKVPVRGSRAAHFRMQPTAYETHMRSDLVKLAVMIELLERGEKELGDDEGRLERLRAFRGFYTYLHEELPKLFERWLAKRETS